MLDSQSQAKRQIAFVLSKARFWETYGEKINERQSKVLARMLREGPDGFSGGMSARKYMQITHCSKPTAARDLAGLLKLGALRQLEGGGRSTRYDINLPED